MSVVPDSRPDETPARYSVNDFKAACGDGTRWEDVDEKRGPMAVVSPESVLALVEAVEAAHRANLADPCPCDRDDCANNRLRAALRRFDFSRTSSEGRQADRDCSQSDAIAKRDSLPSGPESLLVEARASDGPKA